MKIGRIQYVLRNKLDVIAPHVRGFLNGEISASEMIDAEQEAFFGKPGNEEVA